MLTDTAIRKAKPDTKARKLTDGRGMYLLIKPDNGRYWRMDYRYGGKRKTLALGVYPTVTLAEARQRLEEARKLLANGDDPSQAKQEAKAAKTQIEEAQSNTFEALAREWLKRREASPDTAASTVSKDRWRLESYLFPAIGQRPITEITPRELRDVLKPIEEDGKRETASRSKITAGQVFRWAILEGKAEIDPTASLRGLFTTPTPKHRATITDPMEIGKLLRAIDGFTGHLTTLTALKLLPLTFVRPGELRFAEWDEFDFEAAMWRIPAARMKMKAPHLVPLSTQAIEVLQNLQPLTGSGLLVFPALGRAGRPMSENTVNQALRRLGYGKDEMCGHGFRSMAATRLNEMGWNPDAIERQLAHAESNKVRAAYTHAAQYLEDRKRMMQAWADYLDGLKSGAKVVPIKRQA